MRIKYLDVSLDYMADLFRDGWSHSFRVMEGVPDDGDIIDAYPIGDRIRLVVQSDSFPMVEPGPAVPRLDYEHGIEISQEPAE